MDPCPYDLIVFDMDGTLLNSRGFAVRAISDAFEIFGERYNLAAFPSADQITSQVGKPAQAFYEELLPESHKHFWKELHALAGENEKHILEAGEASLFPQVLEVIATIRSSGIKTVILSNCSDDYLAAVANAFGLHDYFDEMLCVGFSAKRSKSELLGDARGRHHAQRVLVVGDRFHDRDAALQNNCDFAAALYGYGSREELQPAKYELTSLAELPRALGLSF